MPATRTLVCATLCSLLLTACGSQEEPIRKYTTEKTAAVFAANHTKSAGDKLIKVQRQRRYTGPKRRMMAAMIVGRESTWFLKIAGLNKALKKEVPVKFAELLKSWKFESGKPTWKTPKGWTQLDDNDPRNKLSSSIGGIELVATIQFGGTDDLLQITRMPTPGRLSEKDWILLNVNRWRRQMSRYPKSAGTLFTQNTKESETEDLDETRKLSIDGRTVVLVQMNTPED